MTPCRRSIAALSLLVVSVALGGCGSTRGPAGPSIAATPLATTPAPTPVVYYEVMKNGEGAHGGTPLIDLPASLAVDYVVRGTCHFTITVGTVDSDAGLPKLAFDVSGREITGTWRFAVTPGSYYVSPGEAVGCTFTMRVYADS